MIRSPSRLSWLVPVFAVVMFLFVGVGTLLVIGALLLVGGLPD